MTNIPPSIIETEKIGIKNITLSKEVSFKYDLTLLMNRTAYIGAKVKEDPKKKKKIIKTVKFHSYGVPLGRIAIVTQGNAAYDHDGFAQVFLPGERIIKRSIKEENEWRIIEVAANPGYIEVYFVKPLALLDESLPPLLKANFTFYIYTEDPIELLSQNPNWDSEDGNDYLIGRIESLVADTIKNFVQDGETRVWSSEDINTVANGLMLQIDARLKAWGLRIRADFLAVREIPEWIYKFIFSCISAEKRLVSDTTANNQNIKLTPEEMVTIKADSRDNGEGFGIFNYVLKAGATAKVTLKEILDSDPEFFPIMEYIGLEGKTNEREMALLNQIIRKKFLNPNICNGEWLDLIKNK